MRVSDLVLSNNYLNDLNAIKMKMQKLRSQIATSKQIQNPSDAPDIAVKVLRIQKQISQNTTFGSNVQNSLTFLKETTFAMENIQAEVQKVMTNLAELNNPTYDNQLSTFADRIDLALKGILDAANSQYDGKYIFGGTDFSDNPFGLTSDQTAVEVKVGSVSGQQKVKVSSNILQKINLTGTEVFGTIVKLSGSLDSSSLIGNVSNTQTQIYDASGNAYTFKQTFTKTAANTYSMSYDIEDSGGGSVFSSAPAAKVLVYNSADGRLQSIDGNSPAQFNIKVPASKIDFNFDVTNLYEKNSAETFIHSANQKTDIFNTLIAIRDSLRAGNRPTEELESSLRSFNSHILNKLSEAGNLTNQLYDAQTLLESQKLSLQELLSYENDVDVTKAVMDLQNQEYLLELAHKISAMVLPKSLLDYL